MPVISLWVFCFFRWNWWNNLKVSVGSALLQNTTKYSPDNLEKLIDETFGENKTLSQCRNTANPVRLYLGFFLVENFA